jgi:transcription termination factor NusB
MLTIQEIEQAVLKLSSEEIVRFREWFEEIDAQIWDKQFEIDASIQPTH